LPEPPSYAIYAVYKDSHAYSRVAAPYAVPDRQQSIIRAAGRAAAQQIGAKWLKQAEKAHEYAVQLFEVKFNSDAAPRAARAFVFEPDGAASR